MFEQELKVLQELLALQTANVTESAKRQAREKIIEFFTMKNDLNWQDVATPYDIVREMLDLFPSDAENFIVFFSMEFLEELVKTRGVSPEKILFIGDNTMETTFAAHPHMYGVKSVVMSKETGYTNGKLNFPQEIFNFINEVNMKFGKLAVIMNPPYQIQSDAQQAREGGKAQAKPLYHLFIESVIDNLNPDYLVSINPSRWMVGGMGLDKFRTRMMNDRHMKVVVDDMSCNGIFPTVDIAGGVNYFMWGKEHDGKCLFNGVERYLNEEDIIIRENDARSILTKVKNVSSKYIGSIASAMKPFGVSGTTIPTQEGVPCWFKQSIGKVFVDSSIVKDSRGDLNKWKVLVPRAPIAGQTDFTKPIGFFTDKSIIIAEPNEVCTETYIVANSFTTKKEAENFVSYMKTKFFRFMLRMRCVSQDVTRENYNWVPDVEDYSAPWSDKELYKKFNLSRQEVAYIESKIKAI